MGVISWISLHWVGLCIALSSLLGTISMALHLIPGASSAADGIDAAKKVIDQLDGQAPKV